MSQPPLPSPDQILAWISTQSAVSIEKRENGKFLIGCDERSVEDRDIYRAFALAMAPPPASISKDG